MIECSGRQEDKPVFTISEILPAGSCTNQGFRSSDLVIREIGYGAEKVIPEKIIDRGSSVQVYWVHMGMSSRILRDVFEKARGQGVAAQQAGRVIADFIDKNQPDRREPKVGWDEMKEEIHQMTSGPGPSQAFIRRWTALMEANSTPDDVNRREEMLMKFNHMVSPRCPEFTYALVRS